MPDEHGIETIIDSGASADKGTAEAGESSTSEPVTDGDLVSTVEFMPKSPNASEETEKTETPEEKAARDEAAKKAEEEAGKKADEEAAAEKEEQEPGVEGKGGKPSKAEKRIKQLIRERDEKDQYIQSLEGRLARVEEHLTRGPQGERESNLLEMDDEELFEQIHDSPKSLKTFLGNFAQELKAEWAAERDELSQKERSEGEMRQAMDTFKAFAVQHDDFNDMWDDGTIPDFMKKNPGHNAMSAYHELTVKNRIKTAEEALTKKLTAQFEKDKKAAVDKVVADIRAGRMADMSSGGGGGHKPNSQDSWKVDDYGGDVTAGLLHRLNVRRGASGK